MFTPAPNKVVIVAGCWNCGAGGVTDRTYRWISLNNGESFGAAAEIDRGLETQGTGVWLDDARQLRRREPLARQGGGPDRRRGRASTRPAASSPTAPRSCACPASNKLVAATNDLDVVKYGVFDGAPFSVAGINGPTNWLDRPDAQRARGRQQRQRPQQRAERRLPDVPVLRPQRQPRRPAPLRPASRTRSARRSTSRAPTDRRQQPRLPRLVPGRERPAARALAQPPRRRPAALPGERHDRRELHAPPPTSPSRRASTSPELAAGADGRGFAAWTPGTTGNVRDRPARSAARAGPARRRRHDASARRRQRAAGGGGPTILPSFSFSGPGSVLTATDRRPPHQGPHEGRDRAARRREPRDRLHRQGAPQAEEAQARDAQPHRAREAAPAASAASPRPCTSSAARSARRAGCGSRSASWATRVLKAGSRRFTLTIRK